MLMTYSLYVSQTGIVLSDLFLKNLFEKIYASDSESIIANVFKDPEAEAFQSKFLKEGYSFTYRSRLRYAFQPIRWLKQTIVLTDKGIYTSPDLQLKVSGLKVDDNQIVYSLPNQKSLLILNLKYKPSYYFGITYIDLISYFLIKRIEVLFKTNRKFRKAYELISYDKEYPTKLRSLLTAYTTPVINKLKQEWKFFEKLIFDYPNLIVNLNWILYENFFEVSDRVSETDVRNFFDDFILKNYLKRIAEKKDYSFAEYITELLGYTNKGINSTLNSKLNRLLKRIIIHTSVIAPQFRSLNYFPDYYLIVNYLELESRLYPKSYSKKFLTTIHWSYLIQSFHQFASNFPKHDVKKLIAFINALLYAKEGHYLKAITKAINSFIDEIQFVIEHYPKMSKIEFANGYQISVLKFVNKIKQVFIEVIKKHIPEYYSELSDTSVNEYLEITNPTLFSEILDKSYYNYSQMSENELINLLSVQKYS